jgi:hypothetical protein
VDQKLITDTVVVSAYVQIVGSKSKKRLTTSEIFRAVVKVPKGFSEHDKKMWIETEATSQFHEEFRKRLAAQPTLKHQIGSTKWEVNLLSYSHE